jgi:3-oxoacyl-[acyl-carrier protein] reductase
MVNTNGATNGTMNGTVHVSTARLDGKVALVTGAGRGIGRGIALELANRGANIVVNYGSSSKSAAETVAEVEKLGSQAVALQADLTKVASISKLFEDAEKHFGHIDIVVSNSGMESFTEEEKVTEEEWDQVFGLNAKAQFFVAQHAYKHIKPGVGGRVVLMSSIAAHATGLKNHALYAGSKCAVEGFTRSFAADFGDKGITVNAIAPGGVKSDMFTSNAWHYIKGADQSWGSDKIEASIASACPLGRVAQTVDVGRVVGFLCSQDGEWVNGQIIQLNGGAI